MRSTWCFPSGDFSACLVSTHADLLKVTVPNTGVWLMEDCSGKGQQSSSELSKKWMSRAALFSARVKMIFFL